MNVTKQCSSYEDDSHHPPIIPNAEKKKVRFFFSAADNLDEDASRGSNASKFSLKAMRDEVSSKLKFSSGERDAPPAILEETGFELLPNCDDDGNSSITIARAEKDYLNRIPPLRTHKAKIKRMFKRKSKMEVIGTICERDNDDDSTLVSNDDSYPFLEGKEVCHKMPAASSRNFGSVDDTRYQRTNFNSKDVLDDSQWKELFAATQKMVDYFLGQQLEEEAKSEVRRPIKMEPKRQLETEELQQASWGDVARRQSYNAAVTARRQSFKTATMARQQSYKTAAMARQQSYKTAVMARRQSYKTAFLAKQQSIKAIEKLKVKAKELPMKVKALPMPKPILKTRSLQKLIPSRESFTRDRPRPSEIEFETPTTTDIVQVSVERYEIPESNSLDEEVAAAIQTFRMHAERLGVNEMELMDVVHNDKRSPRTGFIADDTDGTVITYETTYQQPGLGEIEDEDETTVYTHDTLETYAPTIADTEYTPYTVREFEENLFMVNLVDVFDYFFVPYP